jgi:tellurite resistance protein
MFGAVMGLAGLGLATRSAADPFGLPAWLAEVWVFLGAAALAVLVAAYLAKAVRHPDAVRDELLNPATLGFCAALPVGMTLVAGGLQPYALEFARGLWIAAAALLTAMKLFALSRWLQGGLELGQVNGGWLILFVSGIVFPSSGLALGFPYASVWYFGFSAVAAPFVVAVVLYRTLFGPALPPGMRPSSFILLVPPALIYANGLSVGLSSGPLVNGIFYAALPLAAGLLLASRNFLSWPFGAPWWAFTFPLDALAVAAIRHAQLHAMPGWRLLAAAALILATAVVLLVLVRTILALLRGTLLVPPAPPPPAKT